jgi:hypothetical protein
MDVVNQNLAQLREGLKKMCEIEEQPKFCDDEMRTFLDGTESREMPRLGSLNKEDAQGKGDVTTRKKLLDRRGRLVRCFLCDENHFATDCPMKTKLEWLEEDQVQQEEEKLSTTMEVFQMPTPSKEMLEVVDALAACLDEFKIEVVDNVSR